MKAFTLITAAFLLMGTSVAQAEDICQAGSGEPKTIDDAKAAAIAAGFTDITKMDTEDGCYEAKGLRADGSKFEVYLDKWTLKVIKEKTE